MDGELKKIFEHLKDEVSDLHYRWSMYRSLYAGSPENIALLNKHGPNFFYYVQHLMLDHVALTFSKLTDPNKQGKFANLSLKQIHASAEINRHTDLLENLDAKFEELSKLCVPFRELRNKRIAHADLEHALSENELGFSRKNVDDALNSIGEYMNIIDGYYNESETVYNAFYCKPGLGGDAVIKALKVADKYS